jgi:hypothetical protein
LVEPRTVDLDAEGLLPRTDFIQTLQTFPAAMLLVMSGLDRWGSTGDLFGLAEVVVAAVAAALCIRQIKLRRRIGKGIRWIDLLAGLMLTAEAVDLIMAGKRPGFLELPFGVITTVFAITRAKKPQARFLKVTNEGVEVRIIGLRRFTLAWSEIDEIRIEPRVIRFMRHRGGQRRIPKRWASNWEPLLAVVREASAQAGVPLRDPSALRIQPASLA